MKWRAVNGGAIVRQACALTFMRETMRTVPGFLTVTES